jgi:hypothetical protein
MMLSRWSVHDAPHHSKQRRLAPRVSACSLRLCVRRVCACSQGCALQYVSSLAATERTCGAHRSSSPQALFAPQQRAKAAAQEAAQQATQEAAQAVTLSSQSSSHSSTQSIANHRCPFVTKGAPVQRDVTSSLEALHCMARITGFVTNETDFVSAASWQSYPSRPEVRVAVAHSTHSPPEVVTLYVPPGLTDTFSWPHTASVLPGACVMRV